MMSNFTISLGGSYIDKCQKIMFLTLPKIFFTNENLSITSPEQTRVKTILAALFKVFDIITCPDDSIKE